LISSAAYLTKVLGVREAVLKKRHFSADVVPAGGSNAVTVTFNQERAMWT